MTGVTGEVVGAMFGAANALLSHRVSKRLPHGHGWTILTGFPASSAINAYSNRPPNWTTCVAC